MNVPNKKVLSAFIILAFLILNFGVFALPKNVSAAGLLTQISATPSDVTASATAGYTIIFKTATTIENSGKISIAFPVGFDVSSASFVSWTGFDGTQTLAVDGQTIIITRTSGTSSTAGVKTIVLENIVNTSTTADNYQLTIATRNASDAILDGPSLTLYFKIANNHEENSIGGPYYLNSDVQSHYQANNEYGSGNDLGTLSKTKPISDEKKYCGGWVQFFFDEDGTYSQNTEISNIYYHVWWFTTDNQATLGYEQAGGYTYTATESFAINTNNSPNRVGGYNLYSGVQTPSSTREFFGNSIYNLNIIVFKHNKRPSVISSSDRSSFVIFNLPDDIDTLGLSQDGDLDYDNDGVSDYDELFVYYTDPYSSDTDSDGFNDGFEIENNLNPLDKDVAPVYEGFKKYQGETSAGRFGTSVSSISDIDGDGLDDILVGERGTKNVYLYSSKSGELIRNFSGEANSYEFGTSVSSISDIDGDGLDDILVGAPYSSLGSSYAGSVYLFSSSGSLIRRIDGSLGSFVEFGGSVSSISDIDGDGLDDIVISAANADSYRGVVYIYSSATGNSLIHYTGLEEMDRLGSSISSISDIDGDCLDDVIIGSSTASPGGISNAGSVFIYSSSSGDLLMQYDGQNVNDALGVGVKSISDIDGDGLDDVVAGAEENSNRGRVMLYSSDTGNIIRQYEGIMEKDFFGYAISSVSDMDQDGLDDILIGARSDYSSSYAFIYSSASGDAIKEYYGERQGDQFGYSVSSISDIDGDGLDDILVGAYGSDFDDVFSSGSLYLYYSDGKIVDQNWDKEHEKEDIFDLDDYFIENNNLSAPSRNQTVSYVSSTDNNPYIDVVIDDDNMVSFSQPDEWAGTEEVVFTATDSTDLSSNSNTVILTVSGDSEMNTPDIAVPVVDSPSSITWKWVDNSEIEESYSVDYNDDGGGTASGASDLYSQSSKSSSGSNLTWTDEDLSPNTEYSVSVKAHRSDIGFSDSSGVSDSVYTLIESPTHFSASINSDDVLLSVERFANDDEGLSGYYFENTTNGNNSGWINNNFWQDNGLENSTEYTYSVRYRNGDGVETDPVVLGATTSSAEEDTEDTDETDGADDTIDDSTKESSSKNNTGNSYNYIPSNLETKQGDLDLNDEDLELASQDSNVLDSVVDNSTNKKNWTWVFVIISIVVAGSIGFIILRMRKAK